MKNTKWEQLLQAVLNRNRRVLDINIEVRLFIFFPPRFRDFFTLQGVYL